MTDILGDDFFDPGDVPANPVVTLPWRLTTMERGRTVAVGFAVDFYPNMDEYVFTVGDDPGIILDAETDWIRRDDQMLKARLANGEIVTLRPTVPSDAKRSTQFTQGYPLPVDVMEGIMNGMEETELLAAVDDSDVVHTLVLDTRTGAYARYSGMWVRITDPADTLGNLSLVDVSDDAVVTYDAADENGRTLMRNALAGNPSGAVTIDGRRTSTPTIAVEEPAESVVASMPIAAPIIASVDDLDEAIAFASDEANAGARWYVQRRARALGHTEPMPWEL